MPRDASRARDARGRSLQRGRRHPRSGRPDPALGSVPEARARQLAALSRRRAGASGPHRRGRRAHDDRHALPDLGQGRAGPGPGAAPLAARQRDGHARRRGTRAPRPGAGPRGRHHGRPLRPRRSLDQQPAPGHGVCLCRDRAGRPDTHRYRSDALDCRRQPRDRSRRGRGEGRNRSGRSRRSDG